MNPTHTPPNTHSTESAWIKEEARKHTHARALEIARLAGRAPEDITVADYNRAKQEFRELISDNTQAFIDSGAKPEGREKDDPPMDAHQVAETPNDDENADGMTSCDQLFQVGSDKAEQERIHKASTPGEI